MAQDIYRSRVNALAVIASGDCVGANLFIGLSTQLLNSRANTEHDSKGHRGNWRE